MNILKIFCYAKRLEECGFCMLKQHTRWASVKAVSRRPPVVTIMGHVDHGKTSLLDHLRNSHIVEQEFGGITQHIGAFVVPFRSKYKTDLVTFLDTPGHAAFSAMRQRGANLTDIIVLVVACEDGLLDQTIESINHSKASKVPIIVAVNKVDKFTDQKLLEERIEIIRRQLIVHDVITEADGGEVQLVKISAKLGIGLEDLKESILALAETLDLEAKLDCRAEGRVIEAKVDEFRGKVATILVQKGVLKKGNYLVVGDHNWARVRALFDERQNLQQDCSPGRPIQVTGWREESLPSAGDVVKQVESEKEAKSIVTKFKSDQMKVKMRDEIKQIEILAEQLREYQNKIHEEKRIGRETQGYSYRIPIKYRRDQIINFGIDSSKQKINLVLKCDVDGSLDAILSLLDSYDKDNRQLVKLDLMHYGVGNITENDFTLASSFNNSLIYGFNVKPVNQNIFVRAKHDGVVIKLFNVIYHLIDDLKARIDAQMPELDKEVELGQAIVMAEFIVRNPKKKNKAERKTRIAGCRCLRGSLKKGCLYKLKRNSETIATGLKLATMKHVNDDVSQVDKGVECGLTFEELPSDFEFKPGDSLIAYQMEKYRPKLKWDLKGFA